MATKVYYYTINTGQQKTILLSERSSVHGRQPQGIVGTTNEGREALHSAHKHVARLSPDLPIHYDTQL